MTAPVQRSTAPDLEEALVLAAPRPPERVLPPVGAAADALEALVD